MVDSYFYSARQLRSTQGKHAVHECNNLYSGRSRGGGFMGLQPPPPPKRFPTLSSYGLQGLSVLDGCHYLWLDIAGSHNPTVVSATSCEL